MNSKNLTAIFIVLIIAAGGGGFYAGISYQKSQASNIAGAGPFGNRTGPGLANGQRGFNGGQGRFLGQGQQGRPFAGDIIDKDDNSVTIKLADGSSKIIMLSSSTAINKTDSGTVEDLKQGDGIMAFGTENSDGSLTANSIQIGRFGAR